jgi:threonine/homoserine/homoserine lactone efflux protein
MARRAVKDQPTGEPSARNPWRCWRKGFLSTVLNIKLAMFILTFLPQFYPSVGLRLTQALTYSGVFAAVYAGWLIVYVFAIDKLGLVLRRRRVRSGIEYVTAVILLAFGVNLVIQGIA